MSGALAPVKYVAHGAHFVHFRSVVQRVAFLGKCPAANAIHCPLLGALTFGSEGAEFHPIWVERQKHVRLPDYFGGSLCIEHIKNCRIGHVPFAGSGKAAVEGHLEACSIAVTFKKLFGSSLRPHSVAARRSNANTVEFAYRFHSV